MLDATPVMNNTSLIPCMVVCFYKRENALGVLLLLVLSPLPASLSAQSGAERETQARPRNRACLKMQREEGLRDDIAVAALTMLYQTPACLVKRRQGNKRKFEVIWTRAFCIHDAFPKIQLIIQLIR